MMKTISILIQRGWRGTGIDGCKRTYLSGDEAELRNTACLAGAGELEITPENTLLTLSQMVGEGGLLFVATGRKSHSSNPNSAIRVVYS